MQTNHITTTTSARPAMVHVWNHLDQLFPDEGNLMTTAADVVETVRDALQSGRAVHPDVLAGALDQAARDMRQAAQHLGDAIIELGDIDYFADEVSAGSSLRKPKP